MTRVVSLTLVALALCGGLVATPAARGQDAVPPTTPPADREGFCLTCGHRIGDAKVCPFCGAGRSYPKKTQPDVGPDEVIPPTTPAPSGQAAPGATAPAPTAPTPTAPKPPTADPSSTEGGADGNDARSRAYRDDNMAKGDYYFKTGYYLKASESYRVAVLAEPTNAWKKLAFGHALFAIGNYSYASYALRRAVTQLDPAQPFSADVGQLFPSKRAFEKAVKDLKRYVTYSPRDPAGLSVLGYMLFSTGEDERAKEMFVYLQRLPKNEQDPFAGFFLKQIATRQGKPDLKTEAPPLEAAKEPVRPPEPPKPAPKPAPVNPPEADRQGEEPATVKPAKGGALAE